MPVRVTDHLLQARRQQFVDRLEECRVFTSALTTPQLGLIFVFGPGGIGKTALLMEFGNIAREHSLPATYLDARNIEPTPRGFTFALEAALGIPTSTLQLALTELTRRHVILIDSFEQLAPLEDWLRDSFLPLVSDNLLFVFAGRNAPSHDWRRDPGWQSFVKLLPLRNLSPDQARSYLEMRSVPVQQHTAVLDFTHGHPLALSLVADAFAQRPDLHFNPDATPDIVKTLIDQLVQKVPSPAHRAALEACALVRVTTEGLLGAMLRQRDHSVRKDDKGRKEDYTAMRQVVAPDSAAAGIHELFEWIRGLSFIESNAEGLYPHELAREALVSELRWRNPDWHKELHNRARSYYVARIQRARGDQALLLDFVFLHRDNPVIRSMLEWQSGSGILPDSMIESDRQVLVDIVRRHEGEESAAIAAMWFASQPENVTVYRGEDGRPIGLFAIVQLERATRQELQADPATWAAWEYLQQHAPLRSGEIAAHCRFWMAQDTYQNVSAVQTAILLSTVRYQLMTPGIAYHFLPCADPDAWMGAFTYANLKRLHETDYTIGGKRYGVFAHDWRVEPPAAWLALLAEREVAAQPQSVKPQPSLPLVVLSEPDFQTAVRNACHDLSNSEALKDNPLVQSRMIAQSVPPSAPLADRVSFLQSFIKESIESLKNSPRDAKLYRALWRTYVQPAKTQELAAEELDLPFSTYRRHLKEGIERLVDTLWHKEIGR